MEKATLIISFIWQLPHFLCNDIVNLSLSKGFLRQEDLARSSLPLPCPVFQASALQLRSISNPLLSSYFEMEPGSRLLKMSINSCCSPGRLWSHDHPVLAFWVAGIAEPYHQAWLQGNFCKAHESFHLLYFRDYDTFDAVHFKKSQENLKQVLWSNPSVLLSVASECFLFALSLI